MTGERWPDKRARAVLFAGAKKHHDDDHANELADLGLTVREHLFVDDEVREDNADVKANRIGYSRDCMQFATLEPSADGIALSLWVGNEAKEAAMEDLGAEEDPNPFRRLYGWVRVTFDDAPDDERLAKWVAHAVAHASEEKAAQASGANRAM